ncbi:MAG: hypothetical protein ACJAT4_002558 [Granulosicoccus sp.]|jgi:hypothetical protein
MKLKIYLLTFSFLLVSQLGYSQQPTSSGFILKPDRVFDSEKMQEDWIVIVKENKIVECGNSNQISVAA